MGPTGPSAVPRPRRRSWVIFVKNILGFPRPGAPAEIGIIVYFLFFLRFSTSSWISGVQMTSSASSILPPGMTMVFGRDM